VYDFITEMAGLDSATSSILDLGCGPGIIALALSDRASSVLGVDPDSQMIEQAELAADDLDVHNVQWLCATAEEFDDGPRRYDLVTIGSAFHWMNRELVAERVYRLLKPRGVLALLGNPTPLIDIHEEEGVGGAIKRVQTQWLDPKDRPSIPDGRVRHEEILFASSFGRAEIRYFVTRQRWNIDSVIGFLRSTSWRPDQVLGPRFPDFVEDLRTAILEVEPTGEWVESHDVELIAARR
jgi:SAM-dependent methyltransferase